MATTTTRLGELKGTDLDGCERYAGIRYGKPPVGDLRFRAPEPIDAWDGVYDATAFGPSAPQAMPFPGVVGVQQDLRTSEDCLFLNVFTPKADDGERPVMVWIHGGAYVLGSGDIYDGSSLVRRGDVVVVTLNYRLGLLGWIPLDHLDPTLAGSGNNGIRDQILALRWVQDHISSFGGDAGNVTIFGESAGGGSVGALLAAPDADGLYHRAIIESGPVAFGAPRGAELYTDAVLASLGEPDGGIEALRNAGIDRLLDAQGPLGPIENLGRDLDHAIDGTGVGPHPIVDGVVVTRTPAEAIAEKGDRNVPLLIGTNEDEGTLFSLLLPMDMSEAEVVAAFPATISDPDALVETYRKRASGRHLLVDLATDAVFRIPSLRVADAQAATKVPVWVYLFTWRTPVFQGLLGATHALEIPFVWDMLDDALWGFLVGNAPPVILAEAMQDAWLAFARTGSPQTASLPTWPSYDEQRATLEFGDEIRVVDDPGRDLRERWYA